MAQTLRMASHERMPPPPTLFIHLSRGPVPNHWIFPISEYIEHSSIRISFAYISTTNQYHSHGSSGSPSPQTSHVPWHICTIPNEFIMISSKGYIWGSGAVSIDISPSPLITVLLNPVSIVSIPSGRDSTAACSACTLWAYVEGEASLLITSDGRLEVNDFGFVRSAQQGILPPLLREPSWLSAAS